MRLTSYESPVVYSRGTDEFTEAGGKGGKLLYRFLEEALRREVQAKTDKHLAMRLAMAL